MKALLISALCIGIIHSLAPDHWLPFASIAKAQGWSRRKLLVVSFLGGLGHVGSSFLLGALGIVFGLGLAHMNKMESMRGDIAGFLLIGFGVAYALWGLKHVRHHHLHLDKGATITLWTLMAIFVFGPCEPLIPLMFLATQHGWPGIWLTAATFSLVTIFMVVFQSYLAYIGMNLLPQRVLERWSHVMAGGIITITGFVVMFLGI